MRGRLKRTNTDWNDSGPKMSQKERIEEERPYSDIMDDGLATDIPEQPLSPKPADVNVTSPEPPSDVNVTPPTLDRSVSLPGGGRGRRPRPRGKSSPLLTPKVKKTFDLANLTSEDVKCAICLEVFIEPVTYPCGHSTCLTCHNEHLEKAAMQCHMCRTRLSVWNRRASKEHTLVNVPFWEKIQEQFGPQVDARKTGDYSKLMCSPVKAKFLDGRLACPGEILKELELEQDKLARELEEKRQEEERASMELIKMILEHEGPLPEVQGSSALDEDLQYALRLQEQLQAEASMPKPKRKSSDVSTLSQKQTKLNFVPSPRTSPGSSSSLEEQETGDIQILPQPSGSSRKSNKSRKNAAKNNTQSAAVKLRSPSASFASLEEQQKAEREAFQFQTSTSLETLEADLKFAKELVAEEKKAYRAEWLAENGRKATRNWTKVEAAINSGSSGANQRDKKRRRDSTASTSPHSSSQPSSKRSCNGLTQVKLGDYVTASATSKSLKVVKELAAEENRAHDAAWLAEHGRKATRNTATATRTTGTSGSSGADQGDKKTASTSASSSQSSAKRSFNGFTQVKLDGYVTTSPSCSVIASPSSNSVIASTPPSISTEMTQSANTDATVSLLTSSNAPTRSASRSSSPDSITSEVNTHFQPIVRPPKTPPKRYPEGTPLMNTFVDFKVKVASKRLFEGIRAGHVLRTFSEFDGSP